MEKWVEPAGIAVIVLFCLLTSFAVVRFLLSY